MAARVISVGYQQRTPAELIEILACHNVHRLIDVREAPISRKRGFSKTALRAELETAGIEYLHVQPAGNPFRKEKHDLEACLQHYASYLAENPVVIDQIAALLLDRPVAVLCYERQHSECHRSVLLSALTDRGVHLEVIKA